MSTQQLGEDEIERRLRSLSANLDPIAPRDIYAYIRALPDEHPIRGRSWASTVRLVRGRSASVAAVCASLALAAVIVFSLMLRSAGPSSAPAAPGSATPGGHFTLTGAMPEYRLGYTATLLLDGRVLVAGGFDDVQHLLAAEIYDPATGTFSPTGSMTLDREYATATLLKDGRVLIVGGAGDPIDTAELYDPATGKFSRTGSPAVGRQFHTATLLKDGRVLIVGGGETNTAELYDPATEKFSRTGSMAGIRYFHTATLLDDGRVLVLGGRTRGTSTDGSPEEGLASAEVYDPATGKFSSTGSMSRPREGHTATLLPGGRVLVAGGSALEVPQAGTSTNGDTPGSAELYDPTTGTFSPTGSMISGRANHTATLLTSGRVLVAGGLTSDSSQSISSVELYDPATGTFSQIGLLLKKDGAVSATLLADGRVLLLGSDTWASGPPSAELYRP
jgi:Galactose oxidase, central domain/Kelch motif